MESPQYTSYSEIDKITRDYLLSVALFAEFIEDIPLSEINTYLEGLEDFYAGEEINLKNKDEHYDSI
jgi:hypothetical protein